MRKSFVARLFRFIISGDLLKNFADVCAPATEAVVNTMVNDREFLDVLFDYLDSVVGLISARERC